MKQIDQIREELENIKDGDGKIVDVFKVSVPNIILSPIIPQWQELKEDRESNVKLINENRQIMSKLIELLKEFHQTHSAEYDAMLTVSNHNRYKTKITNIWSYTLELLDSESQHAKMAQYQNERKLFEKFLKEKIGIVG